MIKKDDNRQEINDEETGIYIHIPFCRRKCIYCDFYSGGGKGVDWEQFTSCLLNELEQRKRELRRKPSTLYIGGGTPSLMPLDSFSRLIKGIEEKTGKSDKWDEFTLEVNPEDVSEENCREWKRCGVNRISMGVQTLNDDELKKIGRNHDSATALKALDLLSSYFDNYTVDLIFGLPGQTLGSLTESVEKIIAKKPSHISAYSLMFEEGTALTLLREQGRMEFPSEEECLEMWRFLQDILIKEGYEQYEISNYALPGRESKHNRRYWLGNAYLGLGPSAHSYDGRNVRKGNRNDIKGYMNHFSGCGISVSPNREDEFYNEEILTEEELAEEKIMLSMRMKRGLDTESFLKRFGEEAYARLMKNSGKMIKKELIKERDGFIVLSKEGMMIADEVILALCM